MPQLSLFTDGAPPLPRAIRPMRPVASRAPFDSPDYVYEPLWDGLRAVAFVEGGRLRLETEHLRDVTALWPELADLPGHLTADGAALDGEIVMLDRDGRPRFDLLAPRLRDVPKADVRRRGFQPACYVAYDLLYVNGWSVMGRPWQERRRLLEEILAPSERVRLTPYVVGHGVRLFEAARRYGLPGLVAKERHGPYLPGRRSALWTAVRATQAGDFVIGGYCLGGPGRPLSTLLLGIYHGRRLAPAGQVSGGFTGAAVRDLLARLEPLQAQASPFGEPFGPPRLIQWCRPELVCRVRYGERAADGRIRFAIFEGLRPDVPPRACRVEAPGAS